MNNKITIIKATSKDYEAFWNIFQSVVKTADSYAFYPNTEKQFAIKYWFNGGNKPYVALLDGKIAGTFTIRDNKFGLGSHVANASYMVAPEFQGNGVGRFMDEESIKIATEMGYRALQFNYVISTNERAVKLWQSLGFKIIGTSPKAFYHKELGYVDTHIMWRGLDKT